MKLSDVRRFCIRQQVRVHFAIPGGLECTINEHGATQLPPGKESLNGDVEPHFESARSFALEAVSAEGNGITQRRKMSRKALMLIVAGHTMAAIPR